MITVFTLKWGWFVAFTGYSRARRKFYKHFGRTLPKEIYYQQFTKVPEYAMFGYEVESFHDRLIVRRHK